jgi:uncharacterized protein YkwD
MTSRTLPLSLLGVAVLGGCGGPDTPAYESGEGVLVPAVQDEDGDASRDVTASAYCDDVLTWNSAWVTLENEVLTLVNQRRAAGAVCGGVTKAPAPPLTLDTRLRCAARKHSKDMGTGNFFSHTGSNGSTPWQRITSAGYSYTRAAENIAAGHATAAAVVNGWMASTGHCNNIMNPLLRHLGVGYFPASTSTYKHYWTQDFGAP